MHHMVMARRQVLVQLDDQLVAQFDEIAQAHGTNRSELLRRGALAVIHAEHQREADVALQDSYRRIPQDPTLVAAAKRLASETIPKW